MRRNRPAPNSQESYAAVNFPDGYVALGGGNRMSSYQKHLPELIRIAAYLWALLSEATYVYSSRVGGSTTKSTVHRFKDQGKFVGRLKPTKLLSCLVGRVHIQVSHCQEEHQSKAKKRKTVDGVKGWVAGTEPNPKLHRSFVQLLPFSVDQDTGEVLDSVALAYQRAAISAGYRCILYTCGRESLAAYVDTRWMSFGDISGISSSLAGCSERVNPSLNSLYMSVPFIFSPGIDGGYNKFYDEGEGDLTILQGFVKEQEDENNLKRITVDPLPLEPDEEKERKAWEDPILDKTERQLLLDLVKGDVGLLNVLGYCLFSTWRDGDCAVVDRATMLMLLGKKDYKQGIVAETLKKLDKFVPLSIKPFERGKKATSFKLRDPICFEGAIKDPVLLSLGSRALETISKRDLAARDRSKDSKTNYPNATSARLVEALNSLPTNTFKALVSKNIDSAFLAANSLEGESKSKAIEALRKICLYPRPIYKQSKNTSRIYAVGGGVQNLHRSVRSELFRGCLKLDLGHVQLSVAAMLFDSRLTLDLLREGDVWRSLEKSTGLGKEVIKAFLYSSLFMPALNVEARNHPSALPPEMIDLMLKNTYIESFFRARERYIKNNFNGTKNDVFGNTLKGEWNERLAALIQGYEMLLLEDALDYFLNLKDSGVKIVLWLHDGFYLSGSKRELNVVSNNLRKIVDGSASRLKILTSLRVEE